MLKRFFLNLKGLFDASIVSITKKKCIFSIDISKIFSINV